MKIKSNIKNISEDELIKFFAKKGEKKFRVKQLYDALYKKKITDFAEITNFSPKLIEQLEKNFFIHSLEVENQLESIDGTIKFLFKTSDNEHIETVFLPNKDNNNREERNTLCVSTLVGCPINCKFCATAKLGFKRELTLSEILDQYFLAKKLSRQYIDNIVFMGMGEPLLNYDNVLKSINRFVESKLLKRKSITISTIGIPDKIVDFANTEIHTKIALSLHSPFDEIRQQLIPISKKYLIEDILKSLDYYYQLSHLPITFEYILFKGLNDRDEDIKKLARITRRFPSKINIIPFNDISFIDENIDLVPATEKEIEQFAKKLYYEDVMVITRKSQGKDIGAACGQLANLNKITTDIIIKA